MTGTIVCVRDADTQGNITVPLSDQVPRKFPDNQVTLNTNLFNWNTSSLYAGNEVYHCRGFRASSFASGRSVVAPGRNTKHIHVIIIDRQYWHGIDRFSGVECDVNICLSNESVKERLPHSTIILHSLR